MTGRHERCIEIAQDIQSFDLRTWLMRVCIEAKGDRDLRAQTWFQEGLERFSGTDWALEIDRFHLVDDAVREELQAVASQLG